MIMRFIKTTIVSNKEIIPFLILTLISLVLHFWKLEARALHHDEFIHIFWSFDLSEGKGFSHNPLLHGPFQIFFNAIVFSLFPDNDFTARISYAIAGSLLILVPWFFRKTLGIKSSLAISVFLLLSPSILYFGRFARNDVFMLMWALLLVSIFISYLRRPKFTYLVWISFILAISYVTKETAYLFTAIFIAIFVFIGSNNIIRFLRSKGNIKTLNGSTKLVFYLIFLTLPLWGAVFGLFDNLFGITLLNTDPAKGVVGLPLWDTNTFKFPIIKLPIFIHVIYLLFLCLTPFLLIKFSNIRNISLIILFFLGLFIVYIVLFLMPGEIPQGYALSFLILFSLFIISNAGGYFIFRRSWWICSFVFYFVLVLFFTSGFGLFVANHGFCPQDVGNVFVSICQRFGGVFTGGWQSLGYWLAQQDVGRGNQPFFYYFLLQSIYEPLWFVLSLIGIVYFAFRKNVITLILSLWIILTWIAYLIAGEKMPWLVTHIVLPQIFLSGYFIGKVCNMHIRNISVYFQKIENFSERLKFSLFVKNIFSLKLQISWVLIFSIFLSISILILRFSPAEHSWNYVDTILMIFLAINLSILVLILVIERSFKLIGFTLILFSLSLMFASTLRANFVFDERYKEMLVYAQFSSQILPVMKQIKIAASEMQNIKGVKPDKLTLKPRLKVLIDQELQYASQWYLRGNPVEPAFICLKDNEKENNLCNPISKRPSEQFVLLDEIRKGQIVPYNYYFESQGTFKHLLWFPENYKKWKMIDNNLFFLFNANWWNKSLDYVVFRRLDYSWITSKFVVYKKKQE